MMAGKGLPEIEDIVRTESREQHLAALQGLEGATTGTIAYWILKLRDWGVITLEGSNSRTIQLRTRELPEALRMNRGSRPPTKREQAAEREALEDLRDGEAHESEVFRINY